MPDLHPLAASVGAADAAAILGIAKQTLYETYKDRGIPHYFYGSKLLFPVAGLHAYVAEQVSTQAGAA